MDIQILELIDGAKAAKGLTVEAYVIHNGAAQNVPVLTSVIRLLR